ncbi:MAG: DUF4056 domain-containing protein [Sedimentisphaerales bacterium]|nr:DUF4056 domain-containing protein [Sedimentisphaerales bacterium]
MQYQKKDKPINSNNLLVFFLPFILILAGCAFNGPRARMGSLPTSTLGTPFIGLDGLGSHGYHIGIFEGNGIVYTCKAGHIDIYHLRGVADNTRHLIKKVKKTLENSKSGFSYHLAFETSTHKITFTYPKNWENLSFRDKHQAIIEISEDLGPYLAFQASIWHEILTWFGVRFAGIEPEFNSAFSWEDLFSNLLGARIAVGAVRDSQHSYDKAMTVALQGELEFLGIQSPDIARKASEKMRGSWFTGNLIVDTLRRNFDIGLDGSITPILVPAMIECADDAIAYPVPTRAVLDKYGISMQYEIKPNVFEQEAIYAAADSNRIYPREHFPVIMEAIKRQAKEKGYLFDE